MKRKKILPSIIARTPLQYKRRMKKVSRLSKWLHLDVMDGKFVKNKSLLFNLSLTKKNKYEAHLMLENPLPWIKKQGKKVNTIIVHAESKDVEEALKEIKKLRKKTCLALKPNTPLKSIKNYMQNVEQLLIMTVHPGKYGAKFQSKTLKKIEKARKKYPTKDIEVDGSINQKTISKTAKAGANKFIVGSVLMNAQDPKKELKRLKQLW